MTNLPCNICDSVHRVYLSKIFNIYLCSRHRTQLYKYGKILERTRFDKNRIMIYDTYAEIILYDILHNESSRAKIDLEDVEKCKLYKWYLGTNGYVMAHKNKTCFYLHRFITNVSQNLQVDHINHNKTDNRKINLRMVTGLLNSNNRVDEHGTGIRITKFNKYQAYIIINKKFINLGNHSDINDALNARRIGEMKYRDTLFIGV